MSHYIVKVYGFQCDVLGCGSNVETVPRIDARNKLAESRKQIAAPPDSWTRRGGLDICNTVDGGHAEARRADA